MSGKEFADNGPMTPTRRSTGHGFVCGGLLAAALLLSAFVFAQPSLLPDIDPQRLASEEDAQAALSAVGREREQWAYQLRERERACYERWLINACLADVRTERQAVERRFDDIEVAAVEVLRRARNLERNQQEALRIEDSRRSADAARAASAPAAGGAEAGAGSRTPRSVQGPQDVRDEQARRARAASDRVQRQRENEAKRREMQQREGRAADKAAERNKALAETEQRLRARAEAADRRREEVRRRAAEREAEAAREAARRDRRAGPTQ